MTQISVLLVSLVGALTLLLAGCGTREVLTAGDIRPLHYSAGQSSLERVEGIRRALAASPAQPVRVMTVHGMITHEAGFSDELQLRIAERLGLTKGADSGQVNLERGYAFVPVYGRQPFDGVAQLPPTELRRTAWTAKNEQGAVVERLVFYELLWAPLRDQVKDSFVGCFERGEAGFKPACRPFSKSKPNADSRMAVNRSLKESITLGGFADATLVLGQVGDVIRDDLTLALCVIASDFLRPTGDPLATAQRQRCNLAAAVRAFGSHVEAAMVLSGARFYAVTHSLGSFLFFDAQNAFIAAQGTQPPDGKPNAPCAPCSILCDEEQQAQLLFQMTDQATVFMNANQIALLSLARLSPAVCNAARGGVCPNPYLRGRDPWSQFPGMARMTTYVAFNDTNDLLGFEIPPFLADADGNRYINVSVKNPGWQVPGLLKSPSGAHTHQADNPALVNAIVEGFEIPK